MTRTTHTLADTSALVRLAWPEVAAVLAPQIQAGMVYTCGVIDLELQVLITVLHYDPVFTVITKATGQSAEWVVPEGSLDRRNERRLVGPRSERVSETLDADTPA